MADRTPSRPDAAYVVHDDRIGLEPAQRRGERFVTADAEISFRVDPEGLAIVVAAPRLRTGAAYDGLSRVVLRWRHQLPPSALVLGDAWERSYGDLQWRHLQPDRVLPWSWLGYDEASQRATGMGVRVRPRSFCAWTVDERGCSLWLDLRNGGSPVRLGDRVLDAATVVVVGGQPGSRPSPSSGGWPQRCARTRCRSASRS